MTLRELAEDRWAWDWSGAKPRQALVDGMAELLAQRWPVNLGDVDNVPASNLPFMAYDRNAVAWESGGTVQTQRNTVKLAAHINAKLGKQQAFYLFLTAVRSAGRHVYRPANAKPSAPYTGVEIYLTPPIDRALDADFVRVLTSVTRLLWPDWLDVVAVHFIQVTTATIYANGLSRVIERSRTEATI